MTKHNLDLQVITDNYFLILDEFPAVEVPKGFGEALTELVADKIKEETARIIKLLERQFASSYWSDLSPEYLIALIEEKK